MCKYTVTTTTTDNDLLLQTLHSYLTRGHKSFEKQEIDRQGKHSNME